MTKYEMIANDLADRIKNNEFESTNKIPTEEKLMEEYSVSRNTVRSAIKTLNKVGLVYPIQGSGWFIRENRKHNTIFLSGTRGITKEHIGKKLETKCLRLDEIEADQHISELLLCEIGTPVYYIERLRIIDDIPYTLEYTYYNKEIIPNITKDIAESSIFNYIQNDLNLSFGFADKYISARKLTDREADLLQLSHNDPAIIVEDNIYLNNGTLFNSSSLVYNYKVAHFFMSAE